MEQHLAHFRIIRSYMREMAKADIDGRYAAEFAPLPDVQEQFLPLFCGPSGCTRTFQNFAGLVSVDAAHLKGVAQSKLFTMTTYDANRELAILAFGIASSEDAVTWHWFLRYCLECFPNVSLRISDGAKGVESQSVRSLLDSHRCAASLCARHIIHKNLKTAKVGCKDEDLTLLWKIVRSQTRDRSDALLF